LILMKHFHGTLALLAGGLLLTGVAPRAEADTWNKKTYVTTSQSIEVPGAVLPPGKYVFKLLDSSVNRHIVQIMNERENHVYATNLAIPKERMEPADKTVLTFYEMPGGGPEPIRSWFYPGDTIGQEFAYSSKRATEISQAINQPVPVLAELHQQSAAPGATVETPAPVTEPAAVTAENNTAAAAEAEEPTPPPAPEAVEPETQPTAEQEPAPAPAAQQPAPPADITPAEPTMPKTAGNTAALGLLGLSCLGVAASLRMGARRAKGKS
jgi:hypothetical protein